MKPRRRWFQYSLRSFLVLLTALAVWLGVVVRRATEQREAVEAIEAAGGIVYYDWALNEPSTEEPPGPAWLRRLIGDEYFQSVLKVRFGYPTPDEDIEKLVPQLRRLPRLGYVETRWSTWNKTLNRLRAALPNCEVRPEFSNEKYFGGNVN